MQLLANQHFVVIRSRKGCEEGELATSIIDGEATAKAFSMNDGHNWLLQANDSFAPINGDDCDISGKVVTVSTRQPLPLDEGWSS